MKNRELADAFRQELKKYPYYNKTLKSLNDKYIQLTHEEKGLIGRDMSVERVQGSSDPNLKIMRRLEIIEQIDECNNDMKKICEKIAAIEFAIHHMDTNISKSIVSVYLKKESTLEREARKQGYSKRQLQRRIDEEILKMSTRTLNRVLL